MRSLLMCVLLIQLVLTCLLMATPAQATGSDGQYAIVLASALGKNLSWQPEQAKALSGYTIYVERTQIKNADWERLCAGYFDSRQQANAALTAIQKTYPGAWVQEVTDSASHRIIIAASVKPSASQTPMAEALTKKSVPANASSLSEKQLDDLMKRARSDFKRKRYDSAIRYLKALISAGEHQYSQEALELLGMARQRKGQYPHAVDIYQRYLEQYPEGEASDRIRQRLAGLLTATKAPRKKIDMTTLGHENTVTSYGTLSQYYRNNRASIDEAGDITTLSQLITFVDLTTLHRTAKYDHRYQFTSDHSYDFIDSDDSQFRFIETYYELSYRNTGTSGRIGRQTLRVGGIIRRFDGLSVGYQITPQMRLNLLGGLPVGYNDKSSLNEHQTFYGITFETGTFLEHWDMNLFYFDQQVDGLTDRNSIGTEVRYRDRRNALFGMIDYDIFFDELNILQLNGNMNFDHGRTAHMSAFMRKTPILSTSNALIGRQERSIEELKSVLNIEQIYQLAQDRTADSQTVTLGGSQPLDERFTASADITFTRTDATVASGGVDATPETGTNYFFSTQLVGNNIFMARDTNVLGLRYYDTRLTSTISLIGNARFPLGRVWRINPRLQFDFRKLNDGRSQEKIRALIRSDYRYRNIARFDFELGYDDVREDSTGAPLGSSNLFFMIGYRWDF